MHFTKKNISEKRLEFVKNLQSKKLLRFPGAYNPYVQNLLLKLDLMVFIFQAVLCLMI